MIVSRREGLPYLSMALAFKGGNAIEPAKKAGLAGLAYELLLEGTGKMDALAVANAFSELGTEAHVSVADDGATLSAEVLSRNADAALKLMSRVVRSPSLKAEAFKRRRDKASADLVQAYGSPYFLAAAGYREAMFGAAHPYGAAPATQAGIQGITLKDVKGYLARHVGPKTTALVISGDITLADAKAMAQRHFGGWKRAAKVKAPGAGPAAQAAEATVFIPKAGMNQTMIALARPGLTAQDPERPALELANSIYGGMFGSRLNMNLREDKGYTYGARSSMVLRQAAGGLVAMSPVRADATGASLTEFFGEIEGLKARPITEAEFSAAKEAALRSIPGRYETVEGLTRAGVSLFQMGLPLDYSQRYIDQMSAVTLEQVQAAALKWFDPALFHVVMVGDPETVKAQLEDHPKSRPLTVRELSP